MNVGLRPHRATGLVGCEVVGSSRLSRCHPSAYGTGEFGRSRAHCDPDQQLNMSRGRLGTQKGIARGDVEIKISVSFAARPISAAVGWLGSAPPRFAGPASITVVA